MLVPSSLRAVTGPKDVPKAFLWIAVFAYPSGWLVKAPDVQGRRRPIAAQRTWLPLPLSWKATGQPCSVTPPKATPFAAARCACGAWDAPAAAISGEPMAALAAMQAMPPALRTRVRGMEITPGRRRLPARSTVNDLLM